MKNGNERGRKVRGIEVMKEGGPEKGESELQESEGQIRNEAGRNDKAG